MKILQPVHLHWLPLSAVILTAITVLSLWPHEHLPTVPGGDKLHHLIAYAALMFPAALRHPAFLWAIFLLYLCWSGGIELIQPYVNRYGEWLDLVANGSGLLIGLLSASFINNCYANTRNES